MAFESFRDGLYDLVLLDIKMPDDGFQLYQKIKRIDSRVKICFQTATEFFHEEIRKEQGFKIYAGALLKEIIMLGSVPVWTEFI